MLHNSTLSAGERQEGGNISQTFGKNRRKKTGVVWKRLMGEEQTRGVFFSECVRVFTLCWTLTIPLPDQWTHVAFISHWKTKKQTKSHSKKLILWRGFVHGYNGSYWWWHMLSMTPCRSIRQAGGQNEADWKRKWKGSRNIRKPEERGILWLWEKMTTDRGETMREIIKGGKRKQEETPTNTPVRRHLI